MALLCTWLSWEKRNKYLKDVLKLLEIGAQGPLTKKKLQEEVDKLHLEGVHVFGRHGLFEKKQSDDEKSDDEKSDDEKSDDKWRLNVPALNLLMSQRNIQRATLLALTAIVIAIVALFY